jgi:hypothetical protein
MEGIAYSGYARVTDFVKILRVTVVVKCRAVEQQLQVQNGGQVSWPFSSLGE